MKRKLLVTAMVAAGLGVSGAQAAINLDATTSQEQDYASQTDIDPTGSILEADGVLTDFDVVTKFGAAIAQEVVRYVRLDLTGDAEFVANPVPTITGSDCTPNFISGGAGTSAAVYSITCGTGETVEPEDTITFPLESIEVFDQSPVDVQFRLFEFESTATDPSNSVFPALQTKSAAMVRFVNALSTKVNDADEKVINVASTPIGSTKFVTADVRETPIADFDVEAVEGVAWFDGDQVTLADMIDEADSTLTINGTNAVFSSIGATSALIAGGITVDGPTFEAAPAATGQTTSDVTVPFLDPTVEGNTTVTMTVDGDLKIPTSTITGTLNLSPATSAVVSGIDLGELSRLTKNGSVDTVAFATLKPNQYFKITNPTGTEGAVFLTVYDDSGNQCDLALSDLTDTTGATMPASLVENTATNLFTGQEIGSTCGNVSGQIRVVVDAEFGDNNSNLQGTGEGDLSGVRIDAFNASDFVPNR
ncbi:hypothetical protein [Wenzhouxiangella limi]|uniref:Uncharacterized protein n=1 Tax=Wenzhouxiangella limi TaxID=2707351 RepID=A0A845UZW0_9GAMM|nr:hypothetical protein [Wenzhouxiangella limi]NDY96318.1 hypothetical protein [Wenzhouxiangella limi]